MKFTGERVIPGEGDIDLLNEHMARYRFAQRFSSGKVVLDAACGSGYGSAILAENAAMVFGVDISSEAVQYSREHYGSANIHFSEADCLALPFADGKFDLLVAFEIIEHLENPEAFLKELDRVLHPAGLLVVSTPNRLYYTEERGEINLFHHHEFDYQELEDSLRRYFPHRVIFFENHVPGVLLGAGKGDSDSSPAVIGENAARVDGQQRASVDDEAKAAHYFVAVCARRPLDPITPMLYVPRSGNVLREREKYIRQLTEYLAQAHAERDEARAVAERAMADAEQVKAEARAVAQHAMEDAEQVKAEARAAAERAMADAEDLKVTIDSRLRELTALLHERTQWAQALDREITEKGAYIRQLQADYDSKVQWALSLDHELQQVRTLLEQLRKEFEERTDWALRLDAELKQRCDDLRLLYSSRWYGIGKRLRLSPVPASDRARKK